MDWKSFFEGVATVHAVWIVIFAVMVVLAFRDEDNLD